MPNLNTHETNADMHARKHAAIPAEMHEFDQVRLATDKYAHLGLRRGLHGTIMDICTRPTLGYTVEFHRVDFDNNNRVRTFHPHEIKPVKQVSDG